MDYGVCTGCNRLFLLLGRVSACPDCGAPVEELSRGMFLMLARPRWMGRKGGMRAPLAGDGKTAKAPPRDGRKPEAK